jgi:hypothetical protein
MAPNLIAVTDGGGAGFGLIAGWSLHGSADLARLVAAWSERNLPEKLLPQPVTPEAALGVAIRSAGKAGVRLEKLPASAGGGWAIVDVGFASGLPEYAPRLVVRVDPSDKDRIVVSNPDGSPTHDPDAPRIAGAYQAARRELAHGDMSLFLRRCVDACDGVAVLRDSGGVYYVPPKHAALWREMIGAVAASTRHFVGEIPAMRSDAAVDTILAGLEAEARVAAEALQAELAAVTLDEDGAIGTRALERRFGLISEWRAKINRYSDLFERPAVAAINLVEKLKRNLAMTLEYAKGKLDGRDVGAPVLLDLEDRPIVPDWQDRAADAVARFANVDMSGAADPPVPAAPAAEVVEVAPAAPPAVDAAPAAPAADWVDADGIPGGPAWPRNFGADERGVTIWIDDRGNRIRPLEI